MWGRNLPTTPSNRSVVSATPWCVEFPWSLVHHFNLPTSLPPPYSSSHFHLRLRSHHWYSTMSLDKEVNKCSSSVFSTRYSHSEVFLPPCRRRAQNARERHEIRGDLWSSLNTCLQRRQHWWQLRWRNAWSLDTGNGSFKTDWRQKNQQSLIGTKSVNSDLTQNEGMKDRHIDTSNSSLWFSLDPSPMPQGRKQILIRRRNLYSL